MNSQETVVIIVGAGPSGLATAACLHRLAVPYIILERENSFAPVFATKSYDRLHLHLAKQFCQLPHLNFPENFPTFVSKKDFLNYLETYMSHFKIEPVYRSLVESAKYDAGVKRWRVRVRRGGVAAEESGVGWYEARFLVVATGETSDVFVPEVAGMGGFKGEVLHSTEYKNGGGYEGKKVLVVGSGNSGMEIAFDLANHGAHASVVVRSPMHIMRREMVHVGLVLAKFIPIPVVDSLMVFLSKVWYGDLTKYGIKRPKNGGPFFLRTTYGKYPIVDVGTIEKIRSGEIQVLPALKSINGDNEVEFEDGKCHPFDVILFATGFKRSTHLWLEDNYLLNKDGLPKPKYPNHWKGENGLYCAGLSRNGLYGASMDAQNIAHHIFTLI